MMRRATHLPPRAGQSQPALPQNGGSSVQNILVPVNFSPASARAVEQAVALARRVAAKLTLLHVIDINDPAWTKDSGNAEEFMQQLHAQASAQMDRWRAALASQPIQVQTLIVEGLPAEEIVRRTHDFDLVILGRPRSPHLWQLFAKRTAQRAIDEAECGVLVVHA